VPAKYQTSPHLGGDHVAKCADSMSTSATQYAPTTTTTTTTRGTTTGRRPVDDGASRTFAINSGSSPSSTLSTPRTYVVGVLANTDDEGSRSTSPRTADKSARRCRRRRPLDDNQHGRLPTSKDDQPELAYCSHQSSSTEMLVCAKFGSLSTESPRQRRRRPTASPPREPAAAVVSSTPNLPELRQPRRRRRRSSVSSEDDAMGRGCAEPVQFQVPGCEKGVTKRSSVSRLPRLVSRPQDTLPITSSLSSTVVRAPRPRSFRYSRLHRRAVNALVPPQLRDIPWRWAWTEH